MAKNVKKSLCVDKSKLSSNHPRPAMPAGQAVGKPLTRPPFIYVIDYGVKYYEDFESIEKDFRSAPPGLMHIGKTVPITHLWGPAPIFWGENQMTWHPATGKPGKLALENIRLLSPGELSERIKRMKDYTDKFHAAGVTALIPYLCSRTIAGDHETRKGFWEFYDKWNDYAQWVGQRPPEDPFTWVTRDRSGKITGDYPYAPDYFAPWHRYRPCVNNPHWRSYQQALVRLVAEAGYDGVFMDNSHHDSLCFCNHCQQAFKNYILTLSKQELETLGVKDPSIMDLLSETASAELVRRFLVVSIARHLRALKEAARAVNQRFLIFPNISRYQCMMAYGDSCDIYMFEGARPPGCFFMGNTKEWVIAIDVKEKAGNSSRSQHIFKYADSNTLGGDNGLVQMQAQIDVPVSAAVGQETMLACKLIKVGNDKNHDCAFNFEFILTNNASGKEEKVALLPKITVGYGGERPPMELKGRWIPGESGAYRLSFRYKYTIHRPGNDAEMSHYFISDSIYSTHIGQYLYYANASARHVTLEGGSQNDATPNTGELWAAECAAFSNGSPHVAPAVREKYHAFFSRTKHLYDAFTPYADIGLLYGYWGHNPNEMGCFPEREPSPADNIADAHRLLRVFIDKTINTDDFTGLKTLILCGTFMELTESQVQAIKKFRQSGGEVYVYKPETKINGQPCQDVIGDTPLWQPGKNIAGHPPLMKHAEGLARGLRFAAYTKETGGKRVMALHVVNYNVMLPGMSALQEVGVVKGASITIPVPPAWRIKSVKACDPDSEKTQSLSFQALEGQLQLILPDVRIYKLLEISAE